MADTFVFNQGAAFMGTAGLPSTCYFLLSTKPCSGAGAHVGTDTLGGGVGEITGSGYARIGTARPAITAGTGTFSQMTWTTGTAVNWPASVKSVVLVTTDTGNNAGTAVVAGNLVPGGTARDLSAANTTERVTPVIVFAAGS